MPLTVVFSCLFHLDAQAEKESFRSAAENAFSLQATIRAQTEAHAEEVQSLQSKLRSVEDRCIELLHLKIGHEKDICRLRNEIQQLSESESESESESGVDEEEKATTQSISLEMRI